jgi:hypothetical protein
MPKEIVLKMLLGWVGTISVLLLMSLAVDAQEQSSDQSEEKLSVPPAAKPVEKSTPQSEEQSEEQLPPQPSEEPKVPSSTQQAEQPPARPSEPLEPSKPSNAPSPPRSAERPPAQPAKLPRADAYRLTVTIHGAFGLCHDDEFGSEELYVVVKRLDLELQDRIDDIEREGQQITGRNTWRYAEHQVDSLRKQDFNSRSDPLSEAELESLERLRGIRPTERTRDQDREFRLLRAREPISTADASVLARMRELESQRRGLMRQVQMRFSANEPGTLRVYPEDELQVVLMEDDPFFDDTCFGSTVVLDQSSLTTPSLDIKKDDNTLLTLNFRPLSR